jgi:hypothetical protein
MGQYGDIKTKRVRNLLKWLSNNSAIEIKEGGKHLKVSSIFSGKSFTVPCDHRTVNKHIVKDFKEWLFKEEICTKEEFDKRL